MPRHTPNQLGLLPLMVLLRVNCCGRQRSGWPPKLMLWLLLPRQISCLVDLRLKMTTKGLCLAVDNVMDGLQSACGGDGPFLQTELTYPQAL